MKGTLGLSELRTIARTLVVILRRALRWYSRRALACEMLWYQRLPWTICGAAFFAGTAILIEGENLYERREQQSQDDQATSLTSQVAMITEERLFSAALIIILVLIIACVVCASGKKGNPLHLFLSSLVLSCMCTLAVNLSINPFNAVAG